MENIIERRRRLKQTLEDRLRQEAKADRERANALAPGREREELLRNARRAETASHLSDWVNSPGLRSPTR
jgi:hypothetical protein